MQGRWFLHGEGEVTVGSSNLTSKGYCLEDDGEALYLFENR